MDYINAAALFVTLVTARGHLIAHEEKAVCFRYSHACLKLRPIDAGVVLEITHGLADSSEVCWLDLYSDPAGLEDSSLVACIDYGMELMLPASGQPNEKAEQDEAVRAL